ncbi:MAG TPA: sigma-54 dependent transcriptional regulator [Dissulfurispiraceae bacterium]
MNFRIVIAEDEEITLKHLVYALKREGYEAVGAKDAREALALMESEPFDVLITDVKMPGMSGLELLERVKEKFPWMEVLIITGFGTIDSAVEAMKKGAYEYITKPFNLDELILKVKHIHERRSLKRENVALKASFGMKRGPSVIARSDSMRKVLDIVEGIRDSDCNVLITGEAGVGKSLLAKIIHSTSRRQDMPFLPIHCATYSGDLLGGELFGCERGATPGYIGASGAGPVGAKQGLLEIAQGGTLFLNAVTEIPGGLQARLLGAVEHGEIMRDGGARPVKVNVRFIAAAGKDIKGLVSEGRFMEDLYYRLNVMEIFIPPLRERRQDIEPLSAFFLRKHAAGAGKKITGLSREALDILNDYSFPGNVRELENILERAVILGQGPLVTAENLPRSIKMFRIETFTPDRVLTLDELTREYAEKVLSLVDGDGDKAAELLGISEPGLREILKDAGKAGKG